ncbi:hypothetical protein [Shouchella shacheensis]|uniref:hypothetical protein n=1 Tax=Shouchella shacheensis TaxID=1649580 RepID=UPI000A4D2F01|nr:hypothetical protein [Shouchella shacheensis]
MKVPKKTKVLIFSFAFATVLVIGTVGFPGTSGANIMNVNKMMEAMNMDSPEAQE